MKVVPILFLACCLPRCCASACPVSGALPITPLGTRLIPGLCKNSPVASESCRPGWEWFPSYFTTKLRQIKGQVFDTNVQMTVNADKPLMVCVLVDGHFVTLPNMRDNRCLFQSCSTWNELKRVDVTNLALACQQSRTLLFAANHIGNGWDNEIPSACCGKSQSLHQISLDLNQLHCVCPSLVLWFV